jgi:hypothetical protein
MAALAISGKIGTAVKIVLSEKDMINGGAKGH